MEGCRRREETCHVSQPGTPRAVVGTRMDLVQAARVSRHPPRLLLIGVVLFVHVSEQVRPSLSASRPPAPPPSNIRTPQVAQGITIVIVFTAFFSFGPAAISACFASEHWTTRRTDRARERATPSRRGGARCAAAVVSASLARTLRGAPPA
jgi:hypothetical protein